MLQNLSQRRKATQRNNKNLRNTLRLCERKSHTQSLLSVDGRKLTVKNHCLIFFLTFLQNGIYNHCIFVTLLLYISN